MQLRVVEILSRDHPLLANAAWQRIRRGWIFGSDPSCSQMRDEIDRAAQGRRRDSYSGVRFREVSEPLNRRVMDFPLS